MGVCAELSITVVSVPINNPSRINRKQAISALTREYPNPGISPFSHLSGNNPECQECSRTVGSGGYSPADVRADDGKLLSDSETGDGRTVNTPHIVDQPYPPP